MLYEVITYRLYHDIPFENYNIDHLVISTNGVFVVETKGRSKKIRDGSKQYRVTVENDSLVITSYSIHYTKLYDLWCYNPHQGYQYKVE